MNKKKHDAGYNATLCCICGNYKCNWLLYKLPVAGWVAKKTKIKRPSTEHEYIKSYLVKKCPEFKPMRPRTQAVSENFEKRKEEVKNENR